MDASEYAAARDSVRTDVLLGIVGFVSRFGEEPAEVSGEGEVACYECGEAVSAGGEALGGHVGASHGVSLEEYRRRWPGAPVGSAHAPSEALAGRRIWSDGDGEPAGVGVPAGPR